MDGWMHGWVGRMLRISPTILAILQICIHGAYRELIIAHLEMVQFWLPHLYPIYLIDLTLEGMILYYLQDIYNEYTYIM